MKFEEICDITEEISTIEECVTKFEEIEKQNIDENQWILPANTTVGEFVEHSICISTRTSIAFFMKIKCYLEKFKNVLLSIERFLNKFTWASAPKLR